MCVSIRRKKKEGSERQTLTIERSSSTNEKKNESLVMNDALEWLLL